MAPSRLGGIMRVPAVAHRASPGPGPAPRQASLQSASGAGEMLLLPQQLPPVSVIPPAASSPQPSASC
eukprot:366565-Chlamydomonas_euryale.AAC.11